MYDQIPEQDIHLGKLINDLTNEFTFRVGKFEGDQFEQFFDTKSGTYRLLLNGPEYIYMELTRKVTKESVEAKISIQSNEQYGIPFKMANEIAANNGIEGVFAGIAGMSALGYREIPIFPEGEDPLTAENVIIEYVHKVIMAVKEIKEFKQSYQNT